MAHRPFIPRPFRLTSPQSTLAVRAAAVFLLCAAASTAQTGQFGPHVPSYNMDNVEGEVVNLETELVEPILWLEDLGVLVVVNEPDHRLVFLDKDLGLIGETVVGQGISSVARNPGTDEVWACVNGASSVVVVDAVTRRVTDVLRPVIPTTGVGAGPAAAPSDVDFAEGKAYVSATFSDAVLVYDATTKAHLATIELKHSHNGRDVALNDPYTVKVHGGEVWVLSHLSGNNTTSRIAGGLDIEDPSFTIADLGPDQVSIVNLDDAAFAGLSLPDYDIAVIDPLTDTVVDMVTGVGTTLFGLEADPVKNRLIVSNLEARNAEFTGESSFPDGRVVFNRLTFVNPTTRTVIGTPTLTEFLGPASEHSVMPTDIEVLADGSILVAGYCSGNIAVFDTNLSFVGFVDTPPGPRGLTSSAANDRLFCLNRAAGQVTSYDLGGALPVLLNTYDLCDPTFDRVKAGRVEFLRPNSGAGTTNCASCHMDGRKDGIAWNLSKTMAETPPQPPTDFRDRKGVMVTQSLLGLVMKGAMHWRGEQRDLDDFNGAFEGLLHGSKLDFDDFALLKDYVFSLKYRPNPFQQMNRSLSASADIGNREYGMGNQGSCARCHALPLGTNGDLGCAIQGDTFTPIAVMPAPLRGLFTRMSDEADIDSDPFEVENVRVLGYGLLHEGVTDDLDQFVFDVMGSTLTKPDEVIDFIEEMDTGLAPVTAYQDILDASTAGTPRSDAMELYMLPQAAGGHCDVGVRGRLRVSGNWRDVGMVYDPPAGHFLVDDSSLGPFSFTQLMAFAAAGDAELVVMGVPVGSGRRVGVDRDRDGAFDADEVAAGLDPKDPDTDGDGYWDGEDPFPLNGGVHVVSNQPPAVVPGSVDVRFATINTIEIHYQTDKLSLTRGQFGVNSSSEWDMGEPTLPAGHNHWKKHHTLFIRPVFQEDPLPSLTRLEPQTPYLFRIITEGQNGVTGIYEQGSTSTISENGNNFFRCDRIVLLRNFKAQNGDLVYAVDMFFEVTQGSPTMDGKSVPGRFLMYDSNGGYIYQNYKSIITNGVARFVHVQPSGPQHDAGDKVIFDSPMWLLLDEGGPNEEGVIFPGDGGVPGSGIGKWSKSETSLEWVAGAGT